MNQIKELTHYLATFVSENKKEKIEKVLQYRTRHVTIVLEDIFQSHNASAVIRSCDIFGVQDLHVVEQQYPFELKQTVAMGSSQWVNVHKSKNIVDTMQELKNNGYSVVATTLQPNAVSLYDLPIEKKIALVFGTEHTGLSAQAIEHAQGFVTIPMFGFTQSFNISVSVALCLQHIIRKLHQSNIAWQLTDEEKLQLTYEWYKIILPQADKLERAFKSQDKL